MLFGFLFSIFKGFNSETIPFSQDIETELKSSKSILRLSLFSIEKRHLGMRASTLPELLKFFLLIDFILKQKKTLLNNKVIQIFLKD